MLLAGYLPLAPHGFAVPAYQTAEKGANAWYAALSEIDGDHRSNIAGFEIIEEPVTCLLSSQIEVMPGDAWRDVFLWQDRVEAGTPLEIFEALGEIHGELREQAPLSFLDLALAAGASAAAEAGPAALNFLSQKLGPSSGADNFQEVVLRSGIVLALRRSLARRYPAIPQSIVDEVELDFRIVAGAQFDITLSTGRIGLLGPVESYALFAESATEFGAAVGIAITPANDLDREIEQDPDAADGELTPERSFSKPGRTLARVHDFALDLGSSNIRIYAKGYGVALSEPAVVAVGDGPPGKAYRAYGEAAIALAANDSTLRLVEPVREGAIVDQEAASALVRHMLDKVAGTRRFLRTINVLACMPGGSTQLERRTMRQTVESGGVRVVRFIDSALAAGIGSDLPVLEPIGSMVVDLGGGKTQAAVLALRSVAYSVVARAGGSQMDAEIASYLRRTRNVQISERAAGELKLALARGERPANGEGRTMTVRGRHPFAGYRHEAEVSEADMAEAIAPIIGSIIETVRTTLERIVPELVGDVVDNGIMVTGGGVLLNDMAQILRDETGLPIAVAEQPLLTIINGAGIALEDPAFHGAFFYE